MRRRTRRRRSPSRSTTQSVAPRADSTSPTPTDASPPPGAAAAGLTGPSRSRQSDLERLVELERALLEPGAHVSLRAIGQAAFEGRVVEPGRGRAGVERDACRPRGRPDGAEPLDVRRAHHTDVRETILEGGVELELAPAADRVAADRGELLARRACLSRIEVERAPADRDGAEEEPVPGQVGVEPPSALGERGKQGVPCGEADTCADGRDVVQVAPDPLELQQERACSGELGGRFEAEALLARMGVREAVRHRAPGAGAADVASAVGERAALGRALEPAVLVEETRVEVEDPVPDDVEAEVAGLDHAGVDRPDRHLVRVLAAHGNHPVGEHEVVVDQRPKRLVAVEADPVEVVRLPFVPPRGGRDVDDRRRRSSLGADRLEQDRAVGREEHRVHDRPAVRGVQPREAVAVRERRLDGLPVAVCVVDRHPTPRASASTMSVSGSQKAAAASARRITVAAPPSDRTGRSPGATERSRRCGRPPVVSTSACASPTNPRARKTAVPAAAHARPASKPPAMIEDLAQEER